MICDEAHTALGEKTSAAIRSFPEPIYIGMTATEQLIAKQVSDVFPASVDDLPLADAARRGLIAPLRCLRVPPAAAINSVPIVGGDFEERALAAARARSSKSPPTIGTELIAAAGGTRRQRSGAISRAASKREVINRALRDQLLGRRHADVDRLAVFSPSAPAMVIACIALAIALSGVGYAAITIPKNSVGTAQLKNDAVSNAKLQGGSVGSGKLQNNAVNSAKVADGSLTGDDIDQASLDAVDAATLGGLGPDDFLQVPETGFDSFVASGSSWVDRDGAGRGHVSVTYNADKTTLCTTTGASTGTEAAAYQDVHLPAGAKITTMFLDYVDDAGTHLVERHGHARPPADLHWRREQHQLDDLLRDAVGCRAGRLAVHGGRHPGAAGHAAGGVRRQRELRLHAHGEPRHERGRRLLQRQDHLRAPVTGSIRSTDEGRREAPFVVPA